MVASYEARVAKYEADLVALRSQLREEREAAAKAAQDSTAQHRAALVALEVKIASRDLAHGREVQGLKTALAAAASSRVKALDVEWSQRWENREAQFRRCVADACWARDHCERTISPQPSTTAGRGRTVRRRTTRCV